MLARTEWPQWSGAIPYDALQAGLLYILLVLFCCLACCDDWEGGRSEDEGLRKSIVILEKSVKNRDRLISITSHELKTPLHGIIGARRHHGSPASSPFHLSVVPKDVRGLCASRGCRHERGRRHQRRGGGWRSEVGCSSKRGRDGTGVFLFSSGVGKVSLDRLLLSVLCPPRCI